MNFINNGLKKFISLAKARRIQNKLYFCIYSWKKKEGNSLVLIKFCLQCKCSAGHALITYENLKWKVLFARRLLATSPADSPENLFMKRTSALLQFQVSNLLPLSADDRSTCKVNKVAILNRHGGVFEGSCCPHVIDYSMWLWILRFNAGDAGQNNGFGVELVTFGWRILNDNSKEVRKEDGQTGGG